MAKSRSSQTILKDDARKNEPTVRAWLMAEASHYASPEALCQGALEHFFPADKFSEEKADVFAWAKELFVGGPDWQGADDGKRNLADEQLKLRTNNGKPSEVKDNPTLPPHAGWEKKAAGDSLSKEETPDFERKIWPTQGWRYGWSVTDVGGKDVAHGEGASEEDAETAAASAIERLQGKQKKAAVSIFEKAARADLRKSLSQALGKREAILKALQVNGRLIAKGKEAEAAEQVRKWAEDEARQVLAKVQNPNDDERYRQAENQRMAPDGFFVSDKATSGSREADIAPGGSREGESYYGGEHASYAPRSGQTEAPAMDGEPDDQAILNWLEEKISDMPNATEETVAPLAWDAFEHFNPKARSGTPIPELWFGLVDQAFENVQSSRAGEDDPDANLPDTDEDSAPKAAGASLKKFDRSDFHAVMQWGYETGGDLDEALRLANEKDGIDEPDASQYDQLAEEFARTKRVNGWKRDGSRTDDAKYGKAAKASLRKANGDTADFDDEDVANWLEENVGNYYDDTQDDDGANAFADAAADHFGYHDQGYAQAIDKIFQMAAESIREFEESQKAVRSAGAGEDDAHGNEERPSFPKGGERKNPLNLPHARKPHINPDMLNAAKSPLRKSSPAIRKVRMDEFDDEASGAFAGAREFQDGSVPHIGEMHVAHKGKEWPAVVIADGGGDFEDGPAVTVNIQDGAGRVTYWRKRFKDKQSAVDAASELNDKHTASHLVRMGFENMADDIGAEEYDESMAPEGETDAGNVAPESYSHEDPMAEEKKHPTRLPRQTGRPSTFANVAKAPLRKGKGNLGVLFSLQAAVYDQAWQAAIRGLKELEDSPVAQALPPQLLKDIRSTIQAGAENENEGDADGYVSDALQVLARAVASFSGARTTPAVEHGFSQEDPGGGLDAEDQMEHGKSAKTPLAKVSRARYNESPTAIPANGWDSRLFIDNPPAPAPSADEIAARVAEAMAPKLEELAKAQREIGELTERVAYVEAQPRAGGPSMRPTSTTARGPIPSQNPNINTQLSYLEGQVMKYDRQSSVEPDVLLKIDYSAKLADAQVALEKFKRENGLGK